VNDGTCVGDFDLPNFTSIFLQAEEGAGPGGAALDTWLKGLLAEMQSSIERHLKSNQRSEDALNSQVNQVDQVDQVEQVEQVQPPRSSRSRAHRLSIMPIKY